MGLPPSAPSATERAALHERHIPAVSSYRRAPVPRRAKPVVKYEIQARGPPSA